MEAIIDKFFYFIDEFSKKYEKWEKKTRIGAKKRYKKQKMSLSEQLTILVMYSFGMAKNFKFFYNTTILGIKRHWFKDVFSYTRMVEMFPRLIVPLLMLLHMIKGEKTGYYFIDSTPLPVCHNKRNMQHRTFKNLAKTGKSSMGWFLGFKLHLVINHKGEVIAFSLTEGNVDDRKPVEKLLQGLKGLCFADKGYLSSKLFETLHNTGIKLVTPIKSTMKNKLMPLSEKLLLKKRSIIESVFNVLKNSFNLTHTRHRSPANALAHILATLVAYSFKVNKPKIKVEEQDFYLALC